MQKKVFSVSLLLVSLMMILFSSCLDTGSKFDELTPEREQAFLKNYVEGMQAKGIKVDTTALGVFYVTLEEGTGPYPENGDTVSVKYVGYLMDGNMFDSSFRSNGDTLYTYTLGDLQTISGWEEMMHKMNKGCKMEFAIPSWLAYGNQGYGLVIPPYSTLRYVALMEDVRHEK